MRDERDFSADMRSIVSMRSIVRTQSVVRTRSVVSMRVERHSASGIPLRVASYSSSALIASINA